MEQRATPAGDDPFAPAAAAGVHRLAIPTPFAVGRVNVYLIEDEPLTLVDAGPNSGTSFDELQRGIEGLGHTLEDIELVILSHQHIDHLGLVSLVAARSSADVAAIDVHTVAHLTGTNTRCFATGPARRHAAPVGRRPAQAGPPRFSKRGRRYVAQARKPLPMRLSTVIVEPGGGARRTQHLVARRD